MDTGNFVGNLVRQGRSWLERVTLKSTGSRFQPVSTDADEEAKQHLTATFDNDDDDDDDKEEEGEEQGESLEVQDPLDQEQGGRELRDPKSKAWIYVLIALALFILALTLVSFAVHDSLGFDIPFLDTGKDVQGAQPSFEWTMPEDPRKALVLSSYMAQNVDWLKDINRPNRTDGYEIFRYIADAPQDQDALKVDNPDGRESLAYLTFIIDHYEDLPDYMVFAHGHGRAWHQPTPFNFKLWALNTTSLYDNGYFNIRCQSRGCTEDTMFYYDGTHTDIPQNGPPRDIFLRFWKDMMEPRFGPIPTRLGHTCCAQFAATKAAVLSQPVSFWRRLREPLLKGMADAHPWRKGQNGYLTGLYYEKIWHIVMGKEAENCPSDDTCNNEFFSGLIQCDREPPIWDDHGGWGDIKCEYHEPEATPADLGLEESPGDHDPEETLGDDDSEEGPVGNGSKND